MLRQVVLDRAATPDGGELVLSQRGDSFVISVDRLELMSSQLHGSEEELAHRTLAAAAAVGRADARVLVGGLGMGFTLRAALDQVGARARVVVSEVVPQVVDWNRRYLGHLAGHPLADRRTEVAVGDVTDLVAATVEGFDAILLDVDNGPEALTLAANRRLYAPAGLAALRLALRPGGAVGFWASFEDRAFPRRLARAGLSPEVHRVSARGTGGGGRHVVFTGRRERGAPPPPGRARAAVSRGRGRRR